MTETFVVSADFSKMTSRANHTFDITFNTSELGENAGKLLPHLNKAGTLAFKIGELSNEEIETLPEVKDDSTRKSDSQRLRAVLYLLWNQGEKKVSSDQFYRDHMEKIINQIKDRLE